MKNSLIIENRRISLPVLNKLPYLIELYCTEETDRDRRYQVETGKKDFFFLELHLRLIVTCIVNVPFNILIKDQTFSCCYHSIKVQYIRFYVMKQDIQNCDTRVTHFTQTTQNFNFCFSIFS